MIAGRSIVGRSNNRLRRPMGTGSLAPENDMKKSLLVLAASAMFCGGCSMFAHMQQSAFFSRFNLDRSVKATAYKGIDSAHGPGGGGGMGGTAGGVGPHRANVRSSSTSTAGFMIYEQGDNKFQESEFLEVLTSQIKKEIEDSHANITATGTPAPNEFSVDYKDADIKGRIVISGSARGKYYDLKASVDESNKP